MSIQLKNNIQLLDVMLSGLKVGKMALTPDRLCAFEYDANYLRSGISVSPFYLPIQPGVFVGKRDPFNANFGVFNDSLPDGWGSLILDRYLKEQGIDPRSLSLLERLSLIGKTGRGGLEYIPDNSVLKPDEILNIDLLANQAAKILQFDYSGDSLEQLYHYAGSSGGARPKVFVTMNGEDWLIKFKASNDPDNVGEIEYNYSLLAKECGIDMPETMLFEGKYFGVKRFDREINKKYHVISAAGLLHADYRIPSLDYSMLLTACFKLTRNIEEVYKLFRQMVFNVLIENRDDHAKNFSFLLKDNTWQLSPAYDLLPGGGFNGYHTTTINGKGNPTENDIFAVADSVGLNKQRTREIYLELSNTCRQISI